MVCQLLFQTQLLFRTCWGEVMDLVNLIAQGQRRSARQQGLIDMGANVKEVSGEIIIHGAGEASTDVTFPVIFFEKPSFVCGFELPPGELQVSGRFPLATGIVYDWNVLDRPPDLRMYKGCKIGIVAQGPPGLKLIMNWRVFGVALTLPLE